MGCQLVLPVNRFQLEDGFVKHAQLAVSVGAGDVGAEVHGGLLLLETYTEAYGTAAATGGAADALS